MDRDHCSPLSEYTVNGINTDSSVFLRQPWRWVNITLYITSCDKLKRGYIKASKPEPLRLKRLGCWLLCRGVQDLKNSNQYCSRQSMRQFSRSAVREAFIEPSSNGKTLDFGSGNRGSNPRGSTIQVEVLGSSPDLGQTLMG